MEDEKEEKSWSHESGYLTFLSLREWILLISSGRSNNAKSLLSWKLPPQNQVQRQCNEPACVSHLGTSAKNTKPFFTYSLRWVEFSVGCLYEQLWILPRLTTGLHWCGALGLWPWSPETVYHCLICPRLQWSFVKTPNYWWWHYILHIVAKMQSSCPIDEGLYPMLVVGHWANLYKVGAKHTAILRAH